MFNHMICLLNMRVHNRTKTIMRRCVTRVKLCVFVLGSMMMGIGYRKTQIELLISCALYVLRVVHGLAVLKGHPECLKCGKTLWRPGSAPDPLAGGMGLAVPPQEPFRPPTLALLASLLAFPNPFTKICLCSELNLF